MKVSSFWSMPSLETKGRSSIHLLTIDSCMNTIENHKKETTDIYIISSLVNNLHTKILVHVCNVQFTIKFGTLSTSL